MCGRAVSLQGKVLKEKKAAQHHAWRFENGAYIETVWDKYKPGLGNTVTITTGESAHLPAHACTCSFYSLYQNGPSSVYVFNARKAGLPAHRVFDIVHVISKFPLLRNAAC